MAQGFDNLVRMLAQDFHQRETLGNPNRTDHAVRQARFAGDGTYQVTWTQPLEAPGAYKEASYTCGAFHAAVIVTVLSSRGRRLGTALRALALRAILELVVGVLRLERKVIVVVAGGQFAVLRAVQQLQGRCHQFDGIHTAGHLGRHGAELGVVLLAMRSQHRGARHLTATTLKVRSRRHLGQVDAHARGVLDVAQQTLLALVQEGDGDAFAPGTSGAAHAVHIRIRVDRHIEIDHV